VDRRLSLSWRQSFGGMTYVDRQNAQSSADSAALGAALAKIRGQNVTTKALGIAAANGYINNNTHDTVTVTNPITSTTTGCDGQTIRSEYRTAEYIHVKIVTNVNAYFAPIVGITQTHNCVEAIARAVPGVTGAAVPLYNGNAVVALNPSTTNCGIDTGNSGSKVWTLTGGGIFSNGCVYHPNGTLNIPNDKCITAVGGATHGGGGTHACVQPNQSSMVYAYPADIAAMMPPNPCTGAISGVDPNRRYAAGGKIPVSGQTTFNNDIFCISDFTTLDAHIVLNNSTLYVTDTSFNVKFNGGGDPGFSGTATTTAGSPYKGYYMIMPLLSKAEADSCNQTIDYRGNGVNVLVGTILAPSVCWDYRGNSAAGTTRSQLIVYNLSSNGTADLILDYAPADNAAQPVQPTQALIELTK
jgi:hypothetical protein